MDKVLIDKECEANPYPSPCVRNCCLDNNDICLGCFRSLDEILKWSASTNLEKGEILLHTKQRKRESSNRHRH